MSSVPRIPRGSVLNLEADEYRPADGRLRLLVARIFDDELSSAYPGDVWVDGLRLDGELPVSRALVLVRVEALVRLTAVASDAPATQRLRG